ncbi:MAG: helix-turn-helix transcriptional regulator [Luteolibacter sp.]
MLASVPIREKILQRFGDNARDLRKSRNLSQENLAEKAGLDSTYISGIERGVRNPSLVAIVQLMTALEASPEELLGGLNR